MSKFKLTIGNRNYSSWSLRGWLIMKMSGVEFETAVAPLFTDAGMKVIKDESPNKKVPYLIHDDFTLSESMAIAEYMAEITPEIQLWPADLKARAHARAVCAEMASGLFNIRGEMPMNIRRIDIKIELSDDAIKEIKHVEQVWAYCRENYGQDGPFLFGKLSIADAFYAPLIWRFRSYKSPMLDGLSKTTQGYMKAMMEWPDMQSWAEDSVKENWTIEKVEL